MLCLGKMEISFHWEIAEVGMVVLQIWSDGL